MANKPHDKPENAAATPAPNQTHAVPLTGPAAPVPPQQQGETMNPGQTGTLSGTATPGGTLPAGGPNSPAAVTPSGVSTVKPIPAGETPQDRAAGKNVTADPDNVRAGKPDQGRPNARVPAQHAGGGGAGASPQQRSESVKTGAAVRFQSAPRKFGSTSHAVAADEDVTLSHLADDFRSFAAAVKARDYFTALSIGGEIATHVAGVVGFLNTSPAMTPRGTDRSQQKQAAGEWAEYDRACGELDAARGQAMQDAPTVKQNDWYRTGGPEAGTAPPLGAGPPVGLEPSDVMRILEFVQLARDLIDRWRHR